MRNLKKVIALIAVFAMMVSTVAFAQTFSDVQDTDNYYEAIETLNKLGILTGDDNDNDGVMDFRPGDSITRAEIAVIVARIKGQTGAMAQTNTIFTDVPSTHWASGYIAQATNQGIVNGYGDGTFGPDDKVQYQDVVKMLMVTLGYEPYAKENGGYPTGYLLAAQQQNVLNGVIGGAEGAEATRGQVAQMTNNAIDTPLMDRYVYGTGQGQYVVWDGEAWSPRKTLMNQYLGIQKLRGLVTANNVTALDTATAIDTSVVSKISLYVEDNYLGTNTSTDDYEIGDTVQINVGDTDAAEYLGYDVVVYVKDNGNDTDTLLSITEATGRNTKASFTLDKFDSVENGNVDYLCYMKNDTDRTASKFRLANDVVVIYNNRFYETGISGIEKIFGDNGFIQKNTTYSGEVVVLDNDDVTDYDVVFVNVAAAGVVDEVTARGVVQFMEGCGSRTIMNSFNKIDFESDSDDQLVKITKDGKPFDYKELKQWDVVSVIANTNASDVYYDVEVIGNTAVTGTVSRTSSSETSADGLSYAINGTEYDVAEGMYSNGTIKAGAAGTFYIDKYGKIIAYDKNGADSTLTENYGYVLDGAVNPGNFGSDIPQLQILYKDGSIGTYDFASTITIENPTATVTSATGDDADETSVSYKYKDNGSADEVVAEMIGKVITFSATTGVIKNITMPSDKASDGDTTLALQAYDNSGKAEYDENDKYLRINGRKYDVSDETVVFYIGSLGDKFGYGEAVNDTDNCKVGNGAQLMTLSGASAAAYVNGNSNGYMNVVVIYNRDAGIGVNAGIAYVTSIGTTTVDGSRVLSVQYYQDGELKTSVTDDRIVGDLTEDTVAGSVFKFGFTGDTITSARAYLDFNGTVRDKAAGEDGIPNVATVGTGLVDDEEVYFGAVLKKQNGKLTIATMDAGNLPNLTTTESFNTGSYDVNVYTYDPTRTGRAKFAVGSVGDIVVDKILTNDYGDEDILYTIFADGETVDSPAWGMLDYVFVRSYERKADIVDYMAYEFDYDYDKK